MLQDNNLGRLHILVELESVFFTLRMGCSYQYGFLLSWEQGNEIVGIMSTVNGIPILVC